MKYLKVFKTDEERQVFEKTIDCWPIITLTTYKQEIGGSLNYYDEDDINIYTPFNYILYKTDENEIINNLYNIESYDIISHTYNNGSGVITFENDINSTPDIFAYTNVAEITIPNGVKTIGCMSFIFCENLKKINIPKSITEIESQVFCDCLSLDNVILPNITKINFSTFAGCVSLKSITIPDSVTEIDWNAFSYCESLSNIKLSKNLETIGHGAFSGCTSLTSIEIPESTKNIHWYGVFEGCCNLERFEGKYAKDNGSSLIIGTRLIAFAPKSTIKEYTIPSNINTLSAYAFHSCANLTSVIIPESITYLDYNTFENCYSLTNVVLPVSLEVIDDCAFCNCTNLQSIVIPENVYRISIDAFAYTPLKTVYCKPTVPPEIFEYVFHNYETFEVDCVIYVPADSLNAYKNSEYWIDYIDYIQPYNF